jgi:hypothetical protein
MILHYLDLGNLKRSTSKFKNLNPESTQLRLTSTAHARRVYPRAPRVSLRSHSARSAQPHCPRQRTRVDPSRGLALLARATS